MNNFEIKSMKSIPIVTAACKLGHEHNASFPADEVNRF